MGSRYRTTDAERSSFDESIMCFTPMDGTAIENEQYGRFWETHRGYCQRVVDDWDGNNNYWLWTPRFIPKNTTVMNCIGFVYSAYQGKYLYCLAFDNEPRNNQWCILDEHTPYEWIKAAIKLFWYHLRPKERALLYTPS